MSALATATPIASLLDRLEAVKDRGDGKGWIARCPGHQDGRPSLKVDIGRDGRILLCCYAGCETGHIVESIGLEMANLFADGRVRQGPPLTANERRADSGNGRKEQRNRKIVATYDYQTPDGSLVFQVVRFDPKGFQQRRPNGRGGWVYKLDGIDPVLYHLPGLLASPRADVIVCAGEKDADRLSSLDMLATTAPMGEGLDKWKPAYSETLKGRAVAILADNDPTGRAYAESVARALHGIAERVRIVRLPELPDKGDVSDWLDAGRSRDDLLRTITETPAWEPEPVPDGAAILADIFAFVERFVAYPSECAHVAHTLWIAHAHAMDCWDSTPRISFLSPEPASGKTRALEVTELLVPNPIEAVNVSPAYLFRKVGGDDGAPTLLYDEIDTVFGPKAKDNEDIRGLLNAGHRKGAIAGRCVTRGKTVETVDYPAYCAVALAGLGDLPDTILTRCVNIRMRRRAASERVQPFRRRVEAKTGHELRDRLATWAVAAFDPDRLEWPAMPEGIEDRAADVWEALLAVADVAGGDWPKRARAAAQAFVNESRESTPSLGIRLLDDLRKVFGDRDQMATDAILKALHEIEEAPWAELVAGKPINARGLARRLNTYDVKSTSVRTADNKTPKGYRREDLADAWNRYLSASPRGNATSATSATEVATESGEAGGSGPFQSPHEQRQRRLSATEKPHESADVADVAVVADFRKDAVADPSTERLAVCIECGEPVAVDRQLYCPTHGGTIDESDDTTADDLEKEYF